MNVKKEEKRLAKRARKIGFDVVWSPVNQAFFIKEMLPHGIYKIKGIKSDKQGVEECLEQLETTFN